VVITGASSGLGAGLAVSYAAPGRMLGLIGRNVERLQAVAATCRAKGAEVVAGVVDVADCAAVQAWLAPFDAAYGVDLAIANAGISAGTWPNGEFEGIVTAAAMVRTNLLGVVHTVEALLPGMLARGAGHVAVVSSVAGYRGLPDCPAYCASKAGVRAYGESLRAALAPRGIAVSVIVPGFFASPMSQRFLGPKPFLLDLDQAVAHTRAGLDRRASRLVFPRCMGLFLQAADLVPAVLGDRILRAAPFRIARES
jgi:NADP-dependent 3-hydroxy acid dehydrogenase YdfG